MTVGPPELSSDGRIANACAMTVTPMKIAPSRNAMVTMVLAAFFASGGLNAGTPLAIASTPVSATEPPAKALSSRKIVRTSTPGRTTSGWGGSACAVPVTMRDRPITTIPMANATKR